MTALAFTVAGIPQPKGSTRAFVRRPRGGGRAYAATTGDNPKAAGWQRAIAQAAALARRAWTPPAGWPLPGAMVLEVAFRLPRPTRLRRSAPVPGADITVWPSALEGVA